MTQNIFCLQRTLQGCSHYFPSLIPAQVITKLVNLQGKARKERGYDSDRGPKTKQRRRKREELGSSSSVHETNSAKMTEQNTSFRIQIDTIHSELHSQEQELSTKITTSEKSWILEQWGHRKYLMFTIKDLRFATSK